LMETLNVGQEDMDRWKGIFEQYDEQRRGMLTSRQIRALMNSYGLKPSLKQFVFQFAKHDSDGSGSLDFVEFVSLMMSIDGAGEQATIEALDLSPTQVIDYRNFFEEASEGSGYIDHKGLVKVFKMMGKGMPSRKQMTATFNQSDEDSSGQLDFVEYLKVMQRLDPEQVQKACSRLGFTHNEMEEFIAAFSKFDVDGSGTIQEPELHRMLVDMFGVHLHSKELRSLFSTFDDDGSGELDLLETLKLIHKFRSSTVSKKLEEDLKMCKHLFAKHDKDGSGVLDKRELQGIMLDIGMRPKTREEQAEWQKILQGVDLEFPGPWNFAKFMRFHDMVKHKRESEAIEAEERLCSEMELSAEDLEELRQTFQMYDRSNRGLDVHAVREIVRVSQKKEPSVEHTQALFNKIDTDASGYIDFVEFLHLCQDLIKQEHKTTAPNSP